jgi:hypothetical protein
LVADSVDNRVRVFAPGGTITTFAGGGSGSAPSTGSYVPATSVALSFPIQLASDTIGNLFIADPSPPSNIPAVWRVIGWNNAILPAPLITNLIGGTSGITIDSPNGVAADDAGNVYVSDSFYVWKLTPGYSFLSVDSYLAGPLVLYPADQATGIVTDPTMMWTPLAGATSYDVYLGTSNPPPFAGNSTSTSYSAQGLAANTTYYWQVVPKGASGLTPSAVQSFTTQGSTVTLTLKVIGSGTIGANPPPSPNGAYATGAKVCLTATPSVGWNFASWSGAALDGSNCLFVNGSTAMTASFTAAAQFSDVPASATYLEAANLMFLAGVTTGCVQSSEAATRLYCPDDNVTRQEMAALIVRAVTGTTNPAIYNATQYFNDVPASNSFFPHIQKLMDLGITTGCSHNPPLFCPTDTIPRWEMAMFMIRARLALYGAAFTSSGTPYFADVPANVEGNGMPFPYIQRAYEEAVTNGCGSNPLVFCPDELVTRGQMASFIMRALFNETTIQGPTAPQLTGVSPNTVAATLGSQITVTLTGANTNFQTGDTVTVPSGMLAVSNVVVNSATSMMATLAVSANAVAGPQALVVTSGGQNLTLPLAIRVGMY